MSNKPVVLRPHHGMCLAYFAGEGYSGGFTAHMRQVLDAFLPSTSVVLALGEDTICTACPNNENGVCTAAGKVSRYDRQVLALCGLETGNILTFSEFTERVEQRILTPGLRSAICFDCEWNNLCAFQPSRWKK